MRLPAKDELRPLGYAALILLAAAVAGALTTPTRMTTMLSLAFAFFFYFILPGYCVMLNFNYSALERMILGMAVSVGVVPSLLYAMNAFDFRLSRLNIIIVIITVVVAAILYRKDGLAQHVQK
jgi:uncharacterized membrane protein